MNQVIKDWRESQEITQQELAELLGCTKGFVSQIENNRRDMPIGMAEKMEASTGFNPYVANWVKTRGRRKLQKLLGILKL